MLMKQRGCSCYVVGCFVRLELPEGLLVLHVAVQS
jgi:hypothetical protein